MYNLIKQYSQEIKDNRDKNKVYLKVAEEMGELSQEINIQNGFVKPEKGGPDGVIGEAMDAIISLFDIIYLENPNITEEELMQIAKNKCDKWVKTKKIAV